MTTNVRNHQNRRKKLTKMGEKCRKLIKNQGKIVEKCMKIDPEYEKNVSQIFVIYKNW